MAVKFLDLHKQYLSIKTEIDNAIFSVIQKSAFVGGEEVEAFEKEFSSFIGEGVEALGVGNGTDALEIAIRALELPKDSVVLVPANTFVASAEAVINNGLKVKFVDCGEDYSLDIVDLKDKITSDVRALVVVHLYGIPANMEEILALAREYDLRVIEDCAQAHGARFNGQRVGSFGDVATFSFYPGKNLGAYGDGGMLVSKDSSLLEHCREIAHHGGLEKYQHNIVGRNSRLDAMQAAILRVKLRYLEVWNARRKEVAQMYFEGLSNRDFILPKVANNRECVWHLFVVRCVNRAAVIELLNQARIQIGLHYPIALPNTPAFCKKPYVIQSQCKNASAWQDKILSLPMGEHLENDEVKDIIEVLRC
ncbi:DegT/DnrJ/EryC1/StrS family aminotransferase [Helicobacter turcicus]|uniref:DegT/DnrJ/EryC1/StrS family aminotransferase n=1 Tax=Helicobacter turcicus TaxID=2867412 RepID=A0ABS7JQ17_9HELI|nr:DegT/DnrJ/EryC1/StrS family aminotransferase [Helicobacter turcicus]MBX7491494.1 DegT/DnrJ/EryC1/StrS family aminotransferase [Helicobacter turcicus]MBX7546350.1 DegT/DnrJ/EryC1/StrS family aminotransferase [Helicobacter turcicus]